jgi:ABC-type multidrug transport system ATPase subunit
LHIRNVSKTYSNGVHALKGVTLTIPMGMYGLLGPNGAGKSTPMRMIATLQEPDTGTITLGDIAHSTWVKMDRCDSLTLARLHLTGELRAMTRMKRCGATAPTGAHRGGHR